MVARLCLPALPATPQPVCGSIADNTSLEMCPICEACDTPHSGQVGVGVEDLNSSSGIFGGMGRY